MSSAERCEGRTPPPAGGATHRFFYWRVAPESASAALAALRSWQCSLAPIGLAQAAGLFVRHEPGRCTVMETYVASDADLPRLQQEGDAATAPWRVGERHLESFNRVA